MAIARRTVLLWCFIAAPALGSLGCRNRSTAPASSSELRVGMDLSYPPFEMQDTAGKPDGVSVKLADALGKKLGRKTKIVPMEFSGLIPALKTGNIDIILSSMTANEERKRSIDFSDPYAFTGLALLVRKGSSINSAADLQKVGITIAAKAATTGEAWVIANLPAAKRVVFEDPAACVLEVAQGRADAFIYDQLSIYKYAQQNAVTTSALLKPLAEEAWAIGLAKGNPELLRQVNAFLSDFRAQKGFEQLGTQFLGEEKRALEAAGVPFLLR